jgi:hypothetical protein
VISLLLTILVWLLVAAIVLWAVQWIVSLLPVSPAVRNIILAIVALLLLLAALQRLGYVL